MKVRKISSWFMGTALLAMAAGCGSNTDGTGADSGAGGGGGQSYNLGPGAYCYQVTAFSDVSDGCKRGVADYVGQDVQGNYTQATATFILGKDGSLGQGQLAYNTGLLTREGNTSDPTDATCTWHQRDDTTITITADYTFTASVVEVQSSIAASCGEATTSCTSTWTWTLTVDTTKSPANNCQ